MDCYDQPFRELLKTWPRAGDQDEKQRALGLIVSLFATTFSSKEVVSKGLLVGEFPANTFDGVHSLLSHVSGREVDILNNHRFTHQFGFFEDEAQKLMALNGLSPSEKLVARYHCGGFLAGADEDTGADAFAYHPYSLSNFMITRKPEISIPGSDVSFVLPLLNNKHLRDGIELLLVEVFKIK